MYQKISRLKYASIDVETIDFPSGNKREVIQTEEGEEGNREKVMKRKGFLGVGGKKKERKETSREH